VAYRWLADLQADRAWKSYAAGDLRRARGEALLGLRCGPDAWGSAELRRVLYALLPSRIRAPLRKLRRRSPLQCNYLPDGSFAGDGGE